MTTEQPRFHNRAIPEDLNVLSNKIIGCAYTVSNTLGAGFLEKVYENALAIELRKVNLKVEQQFPIQVTYDNIPVGDYFADLLVADKILIELKTVIKLSELHEAQCINYLKATGLRICLLLNFARPKIEVKRFVL